MFSRFLFLGIAVGIATSAVADDTANERVWRALNEAKRAQQREMCEIWWPTWRPQKVGATYLRLADRYAQIDTSNCDCRIREHVDKTERVAIRICESMSMGGDWPDATVAMGRIVFRTDRLLDTSPSPDSSDRSKRILELIEELDESEDRAARILFGR